MKFSTSTARSLETAICLFLVAAISQPSAAANTEITSRYTNMGLCDEIDGCPKKDGTDCGPGQNPDYLLKKCVGYRDQSVWIYYTDSVRAGIGFGPKENISGVFGNEGVETRLVEWRGLMKEGSFEPFTVIVRMLPPFGAEPDAPRRSFLVVYRLRPDGTSCIVHDGAIDSNTKAREIADASLTRYTCKGEPYLR